MMPDLETQLRDQLDRGHVDPALVAAIDAANPQRPAPNMLGAALWYAARGHHVFPLQPGSKIPWPKSRGVHDATTDPEQIHDWFGPHRPPSNLGLATGHTVDVVDIDGPSGQFARATTLWELFERVEQVAVAKVLTPRAGGMHFYIPADPDAGNRANLSPGIDYRGRGGYVVAPPSTTPTGSYRFLGTPNLERREQ